MRLQSYTILILILALVSCNRANKDKVMHPVARGVEVNLITPPGLPPVVVPAGNPPTSGAISLGRKLFFDNILSSDRTVSCASCHRPELWFTDGQATATGVGRQQGSRNTPSVINAAYWERQFWDGRAGGLEEQAGGPIANPIEMNLPHEVCVERLKADPGYSAEFRQLFGATPLTIEMVVMVIASYERTLTSGNSPFDRYRYGGDSTALSQAAVRGFEVFTSRDKGNCATCHMIGKSEALFTDGLYHNLGAGMDVNGELKDVGRFKVTSLEADRGAFRTPSLRNVAMTAPYMHDGSVKTLKEVIDFYVGGGNSNPQLDREMHPLSLTAREREDLLAFLESLTGEMPKN